MREYKNQLKKMGEIIADSSHAATILRNVPESWRIVAQTIRMITQIPDEIEDRLEAHEADLNALEISSQAATAFAALPRRGRPPPPPRPNNNFSSRTRNNLIPTNNHNFPKPIFQCNNCHKIGHSASRCYAPGGGSEGQAPWQLNPRQSDNRFATTVDATATQITQPNEYLPRFKPPTTKPQANQIPKSFVMVASITEIPDEPEPSMKISSELSALSSVENGSSLWLIDSAASSHLSGNKSLFLTLETIPPVSIECASGDIFTANQKGTINISITSDPTYGLPNVPVTLTNVIYVPKLQANLLSVGRMTNSSVNVAFSKTHSSITFRGKLLAYAPKVNNLFACVALTETKELANIAKYSDEPARIVLWHHRLAHTNYHTLESMKRLNTITGFDPGSHYGPVDRCVDCPFGKQVRAPFKHTETPPNEIGDLVVSDVCGPFETSLGGYKYFVTWLDVKTRHATVNFIKDKSCATLTDSLNNYRNWLATQTGAKIKRIRTDNGGEYTGTNFEDVCRQNGIIHETTSPYTPEHNGIAERYNRTLQEGALTLQHDANLSSRFWVSGIHTVNFIRNRILHSRLGISPHEALWKAKPRVDWLRIYGCKCWALIPKAIRRKGDYRSVEGIFVGYYDDSKAYKVWIPRTRTVLKARDVIFDESNHIERVTIHATDDDDLPNLWANESAASIRNSSPPTAASTEIDDDVRDSPFIEFPTIEAADPDAVCSENQTPEAAISYEDLGADTLPTSVDFEQGPWMDPENSTYGRGKRQRVPRTETATMAYEASDASQIEGAFVTLADDEPSCYKEAMSSDNADKWKSACEAEFSILMRYHTWELVERPTNVNIVGSRWTFRVKRDNLSRVDKFKARLVAQGFSQIAGLDFNETYSPTIRFTSIRLILALACRHNLFLRHIDIKGAYLNGKLEEDVYMRQPEGFIAEGTENLVCKLRKSIYGLKQSGRVWHNTLKQELLKQGFVPGDADPTIFYRFEDSGSFAIAGWYVDDGLLASNSKASMERMIADIGGSFDIQDLGNPDRLLGIRIVRNERIGTLHISQPSFIETIARRFNISLMQPISSPMSTAVMLSPCSETENPIDVPYASLIGSINYCATATRPDIAYATNKCARFTAKPLKAHWEAAKRIVRYLLHTKGHGITYRREGGNLEGFTHDLSGYTDSDFAGDSNDRKSTSGWVYTFNGSPISWASKKQGLVTRSSMEAELVAGSVASAEGIWLIRLGKDFGQNFKPIPLHTDNQSFIAFANNDSSNKRTKHIDTHYHYTRDQITAGTIRLLYIPTLRNPADILTKSLPPGKHAYLLDVLGIQHA